MSKQPEPIMALSLYQPWATLAAMGAKKWETRSWATAYRGPLAIHATQRFDWEYRELVNEDPFRSMLRAADYYDAAELPLGVILAVGRLVDCVPTQDVAGRLCARELAFGDYSAGRFAWQLADMRLLDRFIPARGRQRLWDCTQVLYQ